MDGLGKQVAKVAGSLATQKNSQGLAAIDPIRSPAAVPKHFVVEIDRRLIDGVVGHWQTSGEDGPSNPMLRAPLTDDQRNRIAGRMLDVRRALEPLEQTTMDASLIEKVSKMLGGFIVMQKHDQRAAAIIAVGYLEVVRNSPPWAIAEACARVRENRAGLVPAYCPNEPQFRAVVDHIVAPYRERLAKLNEVLNAPALPPPSEWKPTREELEEKLGRPIGAGRDPLPPGAYSAEERAAIEADTEKRKAQALAELGEPDPRKQSTEEAKL